MIVKRYVVKDMPEALAKIKQDLGHEAVILSSKKIKQRGFLGIFTTTQLEVVAAVNDREAGIPHKSRPNPPIEKRRQPLQSQRPRTQLPSQPEKKSDAGKSVRTPTYQRPQPIQTSFEQPGHKAASFQEADVLREVQELRGILTKFLNQTPDALPVPIQKLREELVANDVSPELAEKLVLSVVQENEEFQATSEQEFRHILTNLISKEIYSKVEPAPLSPESRVVAFVGPTGVGKTTTIAKIAAEQLLKKKRKVGLITTDTFRIAAVEQLKTYANILQIPVEVVFSTEEVEFALEKLKDRDLILIDTAGRNFGESIYVDQLNEFLQASNPDETCLVLSLTTKSNDLEHIVSHFEGVSIDKFIFTKLDETNSYGAIYNLSHRFKKPLAYFTTGQNVPEDIEVATPEQIARLVVGEKRHV
ncbi:flagellar biosynthesis protein FlhF [Effusibacillus lacus]|uniref:Flagellar biosynthesis protein FlhF n=1 Tax=Effusibacillus lacus TaxID=1348429 RepID=A0A292YNR1_9BACL|nr:flagellar biosynthesis protein FlhF [Effusibacillus lacus]TCS73137.1 flagellar biosynthesis protein FlhF [Effusibacillus lacus]GAX90541.1 flagellar biosynthesis protein FlhF [Effusibacillus lacus]